MGFDIPTDHIVPPLKYVRRAFAKDEEQQKWCNEWDRVCQELRDTGIHLDQIILTAKDIPRRQQKPKRR